MLTKSGQMENHIPTDKNSQGLSTTHRKGMKLQE